MDKQLKETTTIDAASHAKVHWHTINWRKVYRNVRRLQARIVKATQEGKWRKVRALQRLLTNSFSGKALAVRRVTENRGKNTPGVDKEICDTPTKKTKAIYQIKRRGYKPLPLRRIYIPKNNGNGQRPLSIPSMIDRAHQTLHLLALDPVAETLADRNSYGFRNGRSPADAIERCFNVLFRDYAAQWVWDGDIRSCFCKISHQWLLSNIPIDKAILKKWLKAGYVEKNTFYLTEDGTPQGGPLSPALCNMTLDGIEKKLRAIYGKVNSEKSKRAKVNPIRFADDIVITASSQEILEEEVIPVVESFLQERGLEISEEKSRIVHINNGFDFLAQNIRKYKGKLWIKPSKKSVKTLLMKLKKIIQKNKQAKTGNLIAQLNPAIRGWANYHRHVVSKKTFAWVDGAIFKTLWQWAKRRHPKKSLKWIKDAYFKSIGSRNWVFSGKASDGKELQLFQAVSIPIQRHTRIRTDANPYDPSDEQYFEKRLMNKWLKGEKGKRKIVSLWLQQKGTCPVCLQKIADNSGWETHHITRRVDGGSDNLSNLVLLHSNCHRQVHCLDLSVVKPGSARGLRNA